MGSQHSWCARYAKWERLIENLQGDSLHLAISDKTNGLPEDADLNKMKSLYFEQAIESNSKKWTGGGN